MKYGHYIRDVIIGTGIGLAVVFLVFVLTAPEQDTYLASEVSTPETIDESVPFFEDGYTAIKDYWLTTMQADGGEAAYRQFKEVYKDSDSLYQHELAHIFGSLLYAQYGIKGLDICDETFSYGCYHMVVGDAIVYEGPEIVTELGESCNDNGCLHGIGHGLVAYFGYETENITPALAVCAEIDPSHTIDGCDGGVFMEFNMRSMHSIFDGVEMRERTKPLDGLCHKVAESAKPACYFWLPQWLLADSYQDNQQRFKVTGDLCRQAPTKSLQSDCFGGIGYNVMFYAESPAAAAAFCQISSNEKTTEDSIVTSCFHVAAQSYYDVKGWQESSQLCEAVPTSWRESCFAIIGHTP